MNNQITLKIKISKVKLKVKVVDQNNQPVYGMKVVCKESDEMFYTSGYGSFETYFGNKLTFNVLDHNFIKNSKDLVNNQVTIKIGISRIKVNLVDQNNKAVPNLQIYNKESDTWFCTDSEGAFVILFNGNTTFELSGQKVVKTSKDVANGQLTLKCVSLNVKVVDQNGKAVRWSERDLKSSPALVYVNESTQGCCPNPSGLFRLNLFDAKKITFNILNQKIVKTLDDVVDNQLTIKFALLNARVVDRYNMPIADFDVFSKDRNLKFWVSQYATFPIYLYDLDKMTFNVLGDKVVATSRDVANNQLTIKYDRIYVRNGYFPKEAKCDSLVFATSFDKNALKDKTDNLKVNKDPYTKSWYIGPVARLKRIAKNAYLVTYRNSMKKDTLKVENGVFLGSAKGHRVLKVAVRPLLDNAEYFTVSCGGTKARYGIYDHYSYELVYTDVNGHKQTVDATNFGEASEPINPNGPVILKTFHSDKEIPVTHMKITDIYQIDGPIFNGSGNIIPTDVMKKIEAVMAAQRNNKVNFELQSDKWASYDLPNEEMTDYGVKIEREVKASSFTSKFSVNGWRMNFAHSTETGN